MKTKSHLIIVGRIGFDEKGKPRGEMARELVAECKKADLPHTRVDEVPFPVDIPEDSHVVYLSKAGRFPNVLVECQKREFPIIIASSDSGIQIPTDVTIPIVKAPNLGLLILALFDVLPRLGQLAQILDARSLCAEGHQEDKTSPPVTMQKIAAMFGIQSEMIGSLRNNVLAELFLGIPRNKTNGFGHHLLVSEALGVRLKIEFETLGRSAYFYGLQMIRQKMEEREPNLLPGIYEGYKLVFPPDPFQQELIETNRAITAELTKLRLELHVALIAKK
ncbi:MAG: hypothetical protein AAB470_01485 [Patescibacteria group bacterium]